MSSMFKKKGGLAFKPKAPSARGRTTTAPPPPAAKSASTQAAETPAAAIQEELSAPAEVLEPGRETVASRGKEKQSQVAIDESKETEPQVPTTPSRRTTRRASRSQYTETHAHLQIQTDAAEASAKTDGTDTVSEPAAAETPTRRNTRTRSQSMSKAGPRPSIESPADVIPTEPTPPSTASHIPVTQSQDAPTITSGESRTTSKSETSKAKARKLSTTTDEAAPNGVEEGSSQPKKRQRRVSRADDESQLVPAPARAPRKRKTSSTPIADGSRSSSRRARSLTPDDAESQTVDLQNLKMSDLTKDLRIGKKFSRHDELRDRERQARLKAKLEKDLDGNTSEAGDGTRSPFGENGGTKAKSSTPGGSSTPVGPPAPAASSGPQFRIVDGQIVVDQNSLVMDRHARAAAAHAGEDMETIEENDFTRLITSSSFMNTSKLRGPNIWAEQETELFYRALRMFGTDFEMISKMFPGKQRRHIKLKYNREERHNPTRIDAAVMGKKDVKMDIEEYRTLTGVEYESVEDIEAEQRKIQEGYEAERQRIADEQAEIMRKKREELFADEDGNEENGDFKKKKKGFKKKGKQAVQYGLNGEPIVAGD